MKKFIIIRGPAGCGKSTMAKKLLETSKNGKHFEADMYFMVDGQYMFNPKLLKEAHGWCQDQTRRALEDPAVDVVVVSNTFIKMWEMQEYFDMFKYIKNVSSIEIVRATGGVGSVHNVSQVIIDRMNNTFEEIPEVTMDWMKQENAKRAIGI